MTPISSSAPSQAPELQLASALEEPKKRKSVHSEEAQETNERLLHVAGAALSNRSSSEVSTSSRVFSREPAEADILEQELPVNPANPEEAPLKKTRIERTTSSAMIPIESSLRGVPPKFMSVALDSTFVNLIDTIGPDNVRFGTYDAANSINPLQQCTRFTFTMGKNGGIKNADIRFSTPDSKISR